MVTEIVSNVKSGNHMARKEYICSLCGMKIYPAMEYTADFYVAEHMSDNVHCHCHKLRDIYDDKDAKYVMQGKDFLPIIEKEYSKLNIDHLRMVDKNVSLILQQMCKIHKIEYIGPERLMGSMRAISVPQPWAYMIQFHGCKVIPKTKFFEYRGDVLIHSQTRKAPELKAKFANEIFFHPELMKYGGYIGIATITGCTPETSSKWYINGYYYTIENFREIDFVRGKGGSKLKTVNLDKEVIYI